MKFSDLKATAKAQLNPHYGFFLLLLLPAYILNFFNYGTVVSVYNASFRVAETGNYEHLSNNNLATPSNLLQLLAAALFLSAMFVMIRVMRNQETSFTGGFKKAFNLFTKGDYFFGAFVVGLIKSVYMFLWSALAVAVSSGVIVIAVLLGRNNQSLAVILFIAAGLIAIAMLILVAAKQLAYSQAQYIFRDALDRNDPIGYNQAVTQSRQLMHGHKWELFLLMLSFILWYLLGAITLGIANILYVTPYTRLTYANYYVQLTNQNIG